MRLVALQPDYRDAWPRWTSLYRADDERAAMAAALAGHAGTFPADLWRAQLLVELRRFAVAEPLLDSLTASRPSDPTPWAYLARAEFEQGRDGDGARDYDAALARAADDTGDVLWRQVRSIAAPDERAAWTALPPAGRQGFLRVFWELRNPRLRDSVNTRIGEHFRRLAEARRLFALLHPESRWNHSRAWRTLHGGLGVADSAQLGDVRAEIYTTRLPRAADLSVVAGAAPRTDDTTQQTVNLEDDLDDRGRLFVRYGEPDERYVWSTAEETWRYNLAQGQMEVTFTRRGGGDQVVTPVVAHEAEAAEYLLRTDRSSVPVSLSFAFWPAEFRRGTGQTTDLLLFPDRVAATAVLYDGAGREAARDSATGRALHLAAPPGLYVLAVDAQRGSEAGRFRGSLALTRFTADSLAVSGLLLAPGETPPSRPLLEAAAPASLQLPAERAVRIYAEVYGLAADGGQMRYDAVYRFARTGGGLLSFLSRDRVTSIGFRRTVPADDPAIETLVVDPGRLPRGHYLLTLEIRDGGRGARAASATLEFDLR